MKNIRIHIQTLYLVIIILIIANIISNKNIILENNKIILKNMNETAEVTNLNKSIEELNLSHTEYSNYIQNSKKQIATALTNEGVETSEDELLETMASNIRRVLKARTSNATATADNITKGKTAWVNGELIVGNGVDNIDYAETVAPKLINLGTGTSFNVSGYEGYESFTIDNFIVGVTSGNAPIGGSSKHTCRPSAGGFTISKSYDSLNGILTIKGYTQTCGTRDDSSNSWVQTVTQTMTCFAYLYIDGLTE